MKTGSKFLKALSDRGGGGVGDSTCSDADAVSRLICLYNFQGYIRNWVPFSVSANGLVPFCALDYAFFVLFVGRDPIQTRNLAARRSKPE